MEFIHKLNNCYDGYSTLKLIIPEYHDDILNNISDFIGKWNNCDITVLMKSIRESNIFTKEEFKVILFETINHLLENNSSPMSIINMFGSGLEFTKDELKKMFKLIIIGKIKRKINHPLTKALSINREMYDAVFEKDREKEMILKSQMLELIAGFIKEWGLSITQEDLLELIDWKCKSSSFEDFFVNKPLNSVKKTVEEIVGKIVEDNFFDDMELVGSGTYSIVFKKTNKIIKISLSGEQYSFFDCTCILNFNTVSSYCFENGSPLCTVGSQNLADCNWYNGLSEEEINLRMYKTFCQARDEGYIIVDIKKENFGLVDNQLMFIDCGFIYKEGEVDINNIDNPILSKQTFEYFMDLYNKGYRVDAENRLSKPRT